MRKKFEGKRNTNTKGDKYGGNFALVQQIMVNGDLYVI